MYYFYVLQSQKNTDWFYKGSTPDLKKRLEKHSTGQVTSTKPYRPLKLVYYEAYLIKDVAIAREMSVKHSGSVWMPLMKRIKESLNVFER
jgi:putative endonuclease